MTKLAKLFASLFGLGFLKPMPGTYASLVVFVIGYSLYKYFTLTSAVIIFIILFLISYYSVVKLTKNSLDKDPAWIVIDEVLGSILILIFIPYSLLSFFLAFIIFRLFDGQNLWPVNLFNKIKTPLGVIADDLVAGVVAIVITQLIILLI